MRELVSSEETWDVFLSHATSDKVHAEQLADLLIGQDLRVFLAHRSIPPGARWREQITTALQGSRVARSLPSDF